MFQDIAIPITRFLFTYGEVETGVEVARGEMSAGQMRTVERRVTFVRRCLGARQAIVLPTVWAADCEQYGTFDD